MDNGKSSDPSIGMNYLNFDFRVCGGESDILSLIMLVRNLKDFSFTQIGGGEGTKDGEWLQVSQFPTSVHVELLNLKRIPDPVNRARFIAFLPSLTQRVVYWTSGMGCTVLVL